VDHHDLTGYYTYRSVLNEPDPTDDFNAIRFGQGELFLWVGPDGAIRGTLAFPADPLAPEKDFMDVTGRVTSWSPVTVEFDGVGRPGTGTADFDYRYQAALAPTFSEAVAQRPTFVGTVVRAKPHGSEPAGVTASLVAVRRDLLPPKRIPGVALIPEAVQMLASRRHRLQHAVWHTVRGQWHALNAVPDVAQQIDERAWWPSRPPFRPDRTLELENGAGEDFLFMHRAMIAMVGDVYGKAGATPPAGWTAIPTAAVPQTVYVPGAETGQSFVFAPGVSGFMVPPPARDDDTYRMFKAPAFLSGVMRPLSNLFRSPRFLSALTLGQLGNMLEFTVHGWMHVRWTQTVYDPAAGEPIGRSSLFDIDPKWDDPANDDLGDFYSSHVHPTFWRLHGWIDDRINEWASANADRLIPRTVDGIPWFAADGRLVLAEKPFTWPTGHGGHDGHGHHPDPDADVRVMEEVMEIMRTALTEPQRSADAIPTAGVARLPARLAFRELLLGVTVPDEVMSK
jgi:hypothetical protein